MAGSGELEGQLVALGPQPSLKSYLLSAPGLEIFQAVPLMEPPMICEQKHRLSVSKNLELNRLLEVSNLGMIRYNNHSL